MRWNLLLPLLVVVSLATTLVVGWAQDKAKSPPMMMSKEAMAAKKKMMEPAMMEKAKMEMMGEKSQMPSMVASEMVKEEMIADSEAKKMITGGAMSAKAMPKSMVSDDQVMMAHGKMTVDPEGTQKLFQQLVARHLAAKKISMMKKAEPNMATMAGKEMRKMAMDKNAMMATEREMSESESSAMMLAREELIQSLMLDEEVIAMVAKAAEMQESPKMASMISNEKMKMDGEKMAKDPATAKGMMKGAMAREMAAEKQRAMMKPASKLGK